MVQMMLNSVEDNNGLEEPTDWWEKSVIFFSPLLCLTSS